MKILLCLVVGACGLRLPEMTLDNRIVMQMAEGCSGSSFIFGELAALLEQHGYHVWNPIKEFLLSFKVPNKNPYCIEADGTEHYFQVEPQSHMENLEAAWNVLNGSITCKGGIAKLSQQKPTVFLFDGHRNDEMADVIPFLSRLAKNGHAHVHAMWRANRLEHLICKVKDCYGDEMKVGHPVVGNGTQSDLCFARRDGEPDDYKVYLNPAFLKGSLENLNAPHEIGRLKDELDKHGSAFGNFPIATYEELTAYEFSDDKNVFDKSVNAWTSLIKNMGITPNNEIIEKHLKQGIGSRTSKTVRDEIYNYEEVYKMDGEFHEEIMMDLARSDGLD